MKRQIILVFGTLIIFSLAVYALCCQDQCHVGGRCCAGVWYSGCDDSLANTYCPNETFDDCLVCECSDPNNCQWVDDGPNLCSQVPICQFCDYDNINTPAFATCSAASDCSINSSCYAAPDNVNGSCCYGPALVDEDYSTNCKQAGFVLGQSCYYGLQTEACNLSGWACMDSDFIDCDTLEDTDPSDNILSSSAPTSCSSNCNATGPADCCDITVYECDNDCLDNFCVTAGVAPCGGSVNIQGTDYYCHNENGTFYIDTNFSHPPELCDDGFNNDCNLIPDGVGSDFFGTLCAGGCILTPNPTWDPTCAFDTNPVTLNIDGDALCAGKTVAIEIWEDDLGLKDPTFSITQLPNQVIGVPPLTVNWNLEREASPDDEGSEDMEYKFTATVGGSIVTTVDSLLVKYCAVDDSDCDGEPDSSDECPGTPVCSDMDSEAPGCSLSEARTFTAIYDVPGLGINMLSFAIFIFVMSLIFFYPSSKNA